LHASKMRRKNCPKLCIAGYVVHVTIEQKTFNREAYPSVDQNSQNHLLIRSEYCIATRFSVPWFKHGNPPNQELRPEAVLRSLPNFKYNHPHVLSHLAYSKGLFCPFFESCHDFLIATSKNLVWSTLIG
jgi:hypothetical protein